MAVGLRLLAKLASPAEEPAKLMNQIAEWLKQKCSDLVPEISQTSIDGSPAIFCHLHPAAEQVELSLLDSERLVVSASTSSAGPGYHLFLVSLLKDWAVDFQASWQRPEDEPGDYGDETDYFFECGEQRVFDSMTTWLQSVAGLFFDGTLDPNGTATALGMPLDTHFESDQLAITPLGPRNREWMRATSQDGYKGKDFFAWWTPRLNAEYYLGRALNQMWTRVRWRPPVSDSERNLLQSVAESLSFAYKLNPTLDYPWAEWNAILELHGADRPEKNLVRGRAAGKPAIGYRRGNVTVLLTGGWRIRIPGSFSDFEFNKDNDLFSLDPPREIWFTSFRFTKSLSDAAFEAEKKRLKECQPTYEAEGEHLVATATVAEKVRETGEHYFVMNTLNMSPTTKAVCTIIYPQADQESWALEIWQSLQPPAVRKT
jgi:hypothetical protein